MLDDIYNQKILEFAGNIERVGALDAPDATSRQHAKMCGSTVEIDLCVRNGKVSDFAHRVKACALGQASSGVMARLVVGATVEELRVVRDQMWAMLRDEGPPPTGRWAELKYFEPVRDYKPRHGSVMLTFDAVVDALDQIAGRSSGSDKS